MTSDRQQNGVDNEVNIFPLKYFHLNVLLFVTRRKVMWYVYFKNCVAV